jgi:hypothetical protein
MSFDTKKMDQKRFVSFITKFILTNANVKSYNAICWTVWTNKANESERKIANIKSSRRNIIFNDFLLEQFLSYFSQLNNRTSVKQNISEIYFIQCKNRK